MIYRTMCMCEYCRRDGPRVPVTVFDTERKCQTVVWEERTNEVVVMQCEYCKRIATNKMEWMRVIGKQEEVFVCTCGQREWQFIKKPIEEMKPEYLVMKG